MSIQRVLIADDDSLSLEFLSEACASFGLQVETVTSGEAALERLRRDGIDLLLTDLRMPGISGVELVKTTSQEMPEIPVILITAYGTIETAVQAIQCGAADFVVKPCSLQTLSVAIERIRRTCRLEGENEYLRSEVAHGKAGLVAGESPAMQELLRTAERIADSKGTVLITGESGTGKERVAHYLHYKSPRAHGPFIRVNCAALSEQLLESELFGHERGAFTGAHKRREGRFELADGGTLLLDEIGEISPALQAKLLRVLEEEEFERVGGTTTLQVDVRVIATTNRDLPAEVARGRFREDLYYRLHVLPLQIEPLREREEDILPLARHFVEQHARAAGVAAPDFSPEAERCLRGWHWPGNVRELENAIHRAVVLTENGTIEPRHLNLQLMPNPKAAPKFTAVTGKGRYLGAISADSPLANQSLADLEREAILCTLEATRGNKTEAARRLGVTARTLSNKMKLWRQLGQVA